LFDELGPERIEAMKIVGLRDEIRRRWPSDQFGPPSKKLIGPMATFLRSLEAKRGGAKRQRPADDLLDPQTSSHRGLGQQSGGRPGYDWQTFWFCVSTGAVAVAALLAGLHIIYALTGYHP
jgi:hypothetical protein